MSNLPMPPHPRDPLNYGTPMPPHSHNRWWMVLLRVSAGIGAGIFSVIAGGFLVSLTNIEALLFLPGGVVFAVLLVVCIKYRRFGYLSGFLLAPFIIGAALIILLMAFCGGFDLGHH